MSTMESSVVVSSKAVDRLRAGHLWIYRSDVLTCEAGPGEVVVVRDKAGHFHGKAFYSSSSLISLRLLTGSEIVIDRNFWKARLRSADQLRRLVVKDAD